MGDCLVKIAVSSLLLKNEQSKKGTDVLVVSRVFSSDTTVPEVVKELLAPLAWKGKGWNVGTSLWDCTVNPPKDISDWPAKLFPDETGTESKTIYSAGWFPSASLQVLPLGSSPVVAAATNYDDSQYNKQIENMPSGSSSGVRLLNSGGEDDILPSQILRSAETRFANDSETSSQPEAIALQRERREKRKQKEAERNQKLENRIHQLQQSMVNSSKNKKTSEKVLSMLIKSRCSGDKYLDTKDRVYLHCAVVAGDQMTSNYRYFSQQDTAGKVMLSINNKTSALDACEFLVRKNGSDFRRLPTTMRLYEAISLQHLKQIDSIVIRCYSSEHEQATTSVAEDICALDTEATTAAQEMSSNSTPEGTEETSSEAPETLSSNYVHLSDVQDAISAVDAKACGPKAKKKSKTSGTVRNMLMKSHAKGDSKRIKMEDRFFLELIVVASASTRKAVESTQSFVFLAKTDNVERLLRDFVPESTHFETMVLVSANERGFLVVSKSITLQEASTKGILKPFDRLIVRISKDQSRRL